ncbi:hypothetical protein MSAN_00028500 [Mycena sanguinolenta]|uniref:Uncharacterized protein n=1 Tax=Mycena sanguinolenta TaxID=230812 RepID=A0A8H7DM06_9AGAR|nr:hypothetical protein MSAN_00028500 [Mycena sanguinolenta]
MSRRPRLFSEFLDGSDVGRPSSLLSTGPIDVAQKRRKASGLNSRFDRMLQTVNVTHRSPVRKRARSTSSTSGSSVPKTPIDEYDQFHRDAKLGADFSVMKMGDRKKRVKKPVVLPWEQDSSSSDIAEPPPPPLPSWLASTFSTLNTEHPLRLLLPRRTNTEPTPPAMDQDAEDNSNPFSVFVLADPIHVSSPSDHDPSDETENILEPPLQSTQIPLRCISPAFSYCPLNETENISGPSLQPIETPQPIEPAFRYHPPNETDNILGPCLEPIQTPPRPIKHAFIYHPPPLPAKSSSLPFSTPGPGPVSRSDSIPLPLPFPEPAYVEHVPHFVHDSVGATPSFFAPPLHSAPPQFPVKNTTTASTVLPPDRGEQPINCPKSNHSAYTDIFSTPGPGYYAVSAVYFDSPTEDPSDSDPLEPAYELESLDFRWKPFIQKDENQHDVTPAPPTPSPAVSDYYYETRVEPEGGDDEDEQLLTGINPGTMFDERAPSPSQSRFSFAPPADDLPATRGESCEQSQNFPSTPQPPDPPFFAPSAGIFISPLRGDEAPNTPPKVVESPTDGENPCCSQASNDTIEDWDC